MIEELKNTFKSFNEKFSKKDTIAKIRSDNFEKFVQLGFPNKKLEDWKFSDFNRIISNKFKNININLEQQNKFKFDNYIKEFEHNKIIFLNSLFFFINSLIKNKSSFILVFLFCSKLRSYKAFTYLFTTSSLRVFIIIF